MLLGLPIVCDSLRLRSWRRKVVISFWKARKADFNMSASAAPNQGWPAMSLAETHARLTAPGTRFETVEVGIRGLPTRCWKHAPGTLRDPLATGRLHGRRDLLALEA